MPDCSATSITIGGRISTIEEFTTLLDSLTADGAGIDWEYCDDRAELCTHLLDGADEGAVVFSDNERPWGNWGFIVEACEKLGLHYCIADDGYVGGWAPYHLYYHPESGKIEMEGGGESHEPLIGLSTLAQWRDEGVLSERVREYERLATLPRFEIAPDVLARIAGKSATGEGPPETHEPPEAGFV